MTTLMTFTARETIAANSSGDPYDTWFGAEMQNAPHYDPEMPCTITGGFFHIEGGDGNVVIQDDTGVKTDPEFPYGDPGYHVHFIQAPYAGAFTVVATVECEHA